ncbi:MAG TPA: DUF4097 family beta strand repeat-containing protein [Streptosporangiaceae bacterium]
MATWEFPGSDPIDLRVACAAGSVTITAHSTDVITVVATRSSHGDANDAVDDVIVDFADGRLEFSQEANRGLRWKSYGLHVRIVVPAGSVANVRTASADVTARGQYGAVDIYTASGDVDVQQVTGTADITTMSGALQLAEAGEGQLQTASGRISVRHAAGDLTARTASGSITIGAADASVTAKSASGQVRIGAVRRGRTDVNGVSGDVEVKVVEGTGVYLDLASVTGRVRSDLDPSGDGTSAEVPGENLTLHCRTVSGSISVGRAPAAEMAS